MLVCCVPVTGGLTCVAVRSTVLCLIDALLDLDDWNVSGVGMLRRSWSLEPGGAGDECAGRMVTSSMAGSGGIQAWAGLCFTARRVELLPEMMS
jgi:hypothetical protein